MPIDPRDPNRNANAVPTGPPVRNQGGITAPQTPTPRPFVAPPPHTRARKDSIVRPVAPTRPILQARPTPPPPPAVEPVQAQEGLREVKTTITEPDGSQVTTKGPEGSLAQQERAQAERTPEGESPVRGVAQGHYNAVVDRAEEDWERAVGRQFPGVGARARVDAERQLAEFGDFPGKGDPNYPSPPIRPFGRSFNPFTGKFTKSRSPGGFEMLGIDVDRIAQEYTRRGR